MLLIILSALDLARGFPVSRRVLLQPNPAVARVPESLLSSLSQLGAQWSELSKSTGPEIAPVDYSLLLMDVLANPKEFELFNYRDATCLDTLGNVTGEESRPRIETSKWAPKTPCAYPPATCLTGGLVSKAILGPRWGSCCDLGIRLVAYQCFDACALLNSTTQPDIARFVGFWFFDLCQLPASFLHCASPTNVSMPPPPSPQLPPPPPPPPPPPVPAPAPAVAGGPQAAGAVASALTAAYLTVMSRPNPDLVCVGYLVDYLGGGESQKSSALLVTQRQRCPADSATVGRSPLCRPLPVPRPWRRRTARAAAVPAVLRPSAGGRAAPWLHRLLRGEPLPCFLFLHSALV